MDTLLYDELVPWYRLLDRAEDHVEEAASYVSAFARGLGARRGQILELGAGAGNNAFYLAEAGHELTLVDLSESMLGLSRALNPSSQHVQGDLRTVRLARTFDGVFVHDAIMYMKTEDELREALATARLHTKPGGVVVVAPDLFAEDFEESTEVHEASEGSRALRCLEWTWDPDPSDDSFVTEYSFLLRDGTTMKAVHDRHVEGMFTRETWRRVFAETGWEDLETMPRDLGAGEYDELFVARRA